MVKDFLSKRRDQKEIDGMINRFYKIRANGESITGKLSQFVSLGKSLWLVMETQEGEVKVSFDNVQSMQEVGAKFRLEELIQITKSRNEVRSTNLNWITGAAKPVRDAARTWFNEEVAKARHQISILTNLFPHRKYQDLDSQLDRIVAEFNASESMLDDVLALVEARKVTQISQIYHGKVSAPRLDAEEEPDAVVAFVGLFVAAGHLDDLVKRIDSVVDSIADAVTITKIVQETD
jgi:hypothetical protein